MKSFRLRLLRVFGWMLGFDLSEVTYEDVLPEKKEPEYFIWRPDFSDTYIMGRVVPRGFPFHNINDQLGPFPKSEAIAIMKKKNGIK